MTKVALRQQQQYGASAPDQGHEAFVADFTQSFLNAEVREGEQLYAQLPESWNPKILMAGRRVVWKVRKAMLGLRTSPRRWQEHLSSKLKEHGFVQDGRDPCLCGEGEDVVGVHTLLSGVVQVCHELLVGEEEEKVKERGRQEERQVK